jgi:hypothetical protein
VPLPSRARLATRKDQQVSATIVDPAHIDVLLDIAIQHERDSDKPLSWWSYDELGEYGLHELTADTATGQMLLAECVTSVAHRYPDVPRGELPGLVQSPLATEYVYRPTGRTFSPAEALAAIAWLASQSSYHPGWRVSVAKAFCDALRQKILTIANLADRSWHWMLDGERWDWTDERLGRVTAQPLDRCASGGSANERHAHRRRPAPKAGNR